MWKVRTIVAETIRAWKPMLLEWWLIIGGRGVRALLKVNGNGRHVAVV